MYPLLLSHSDFSVHQDPFTSSEVLYRYRRRQLSSPIPDRQELRMSTRSVGDGQGLTLRTELDSANFHEIVFFLVSRRL